MFSSLNWRRSDTILWVKFVLSLSSKIEKIMRAQGERAGIARMGSCFWKMICVSRKCQRLEDAVKTRNKTAEEAESELDNVRAFAKENLEELAAKVDPHTLFPLFRNILLSVCRDVCVCEVRPFFFFFP